ncbi:hypothetical protein TRVL_06557 [Trypanosoma vivax]|nr:hypothetical protein TRVL_06557 [Trypanosoma vivax]
MASASPRRRLLSCFLPDACCSACSLPTAPLSEKPLCPDRPDATPATRIAEIGGGVLRHITARSTTTSVTVQWRRQLATVPAILVLVQNTSRRNIPDAVCPFITLAHLQAHSGAGQIPLRVPSSSIRRILPLL